VPAGVHRVRFEYRPVLLFAGLAISAVSWAVLGIVGVIALAMLVRRRAANRGYSLPPD
jgi:hypothetical protein